MAKVSSNYRPVSSTYRGGPAAVFVSGRLAGFVVRDGKRGYRAIRNWANIGYFASGAEASSALLKSAHGANEAIRRG